MDIKPPDNKPTPKAKAVKWKLAKGEAANIPSPFGIVKVTNNDLNSPSVIKMITEIERQRGVILFGEVFVKDE